MEHTNNQQQFSPKTKQRHRDYDGGGGGGGIRNYGLGLGSFPFENDYQTTDTTKTPQSPQPELPLQQYSSSYPSPAKSTKSDSSEDLSLSSLRRHHDHSTAFNDLWPELWLHPDINKVTESVLEQVSGGNFIYKSAWLLMHICDLQIVYQLSNVAAANNSTNFLLVEVPQSAMLSPTLVLHIAETLSVRHIKHHIPPDCFMEREIQLRALVSALSLLQLFPSSSNRPRLHSQASDTLHGNVVELSNDLHASKGSAADKGDCEFMIRYALNLLTCLPGDETTAVKVASNFANFLFAAGMAYQYNGPDAIKHLKLAFRKIEPKPSSWHVEFDQIHHLTIIVISWSLYDPSAKQAFRQLCSDLIAQLRQKLRDGLSIANERYGNSRSLFWGKFANRAADLAGVEPYDSPVHMTYGLMYLIGRLVERLVADGGGREGGEKENMDELKRLLIWIIQTSRFDEIKSKAYEILFCALTNMRTPSTKDLSVFKSIARPRRYSGEPQSREQEKRNRKLVGEWNAHMETLTTRRQLIIYSLAGLDVEAIRQAREGYAPTVLQRIENGKQQTRLLGRGMIRRAGERLSGLLSAHEALSESDEEQDTLGALPMKRNHSHELQTSHTDRRSIRSHHSVVGGESPNQSYSDTDQYKYMAEHGERRQSHTDWHPDALRTPEIPHGMGPNRMRAGSYSNLNISFRSQEDISQSDHTIKPTGHEHMWHEEPLPFSLDGVSVAESSKEKIKGTPVACRISDSALNVAFLLRSHLCIYSVLSSQNGESLKLSLQLSQAFSTTANGVSNGFVSVALNDKYAAAITRDRLEIIDFTKKTQTESFRTCLDDFTSQRAVRLCRVAVSRSTSSTLVAVGVVKKDRSSAILIYDLHESRGYLQARFQKTLEFEKYVEQPHGEPQSLAFSSDGSYIIGTLETRGAILTWDLESGIVSPDYTTVIPVNDGVGFGRAGITSASLFPSNRYLLATTGSNTLPAVIKPRSRSRTRPRTMDVLTPQASITVGAVAVDENGFALLAKSGKIFVSKLEGDGSSSTSGGSMGTGIATGFRSGSQRLLAEVGNCSVGDLKWTLDDCDSDGDNYGGGGRGGSDSSGTGDGQRRRRPVLLAAFVIVSPFRGYSTRILRYKFS